MRRHFRYILKYVQHSVIDETEEMAQNIIRTFKVMVSELDWMDQVSTFRRRFFFNFTFFIHKEEFFIYFQTTKSMAMVKADHVRKFIGYPTWLKNPAAVQAYYAGLKFTNSFFHNMLTLMKWLSLRSLKIIGQRVDLSWPDDTDSPAEANAFYVDELNAICTDVPIH